MLRSLSVTWIQFWKHSCFMTYSESVDCCGSATEKLRGPYRLVIVEEMSRSLCVAESNYNIGHEKKQLAFIIRSGRLGPTTESNLCIRTTAHCSWLESRAVHDVKFLWRSRISAVWLSRRAVTFRTDCNFSGVLWQRKTKYCCSSQGDSWWRQRWVPWQHLV